MTMHHFVLTDDVLYASYLKVYIAVENILLKMQYLPRKCSAAEV